MRERIMMYLHRCPACGRHISKQLEDAQACYDCGGQLVVDGAYHPDMGPPVPDPAPKAPGSNGHNGHHLPGKLNKAVLLASVTVPPQPPAVAAGSSPACSWCEDRRTITIRRPTGDYEASCPRCVVSAVVVKRTNKDD